MNYKKVRFYENLLTAAAVLFVFINFFVPASAQPWIGGTALLLIAVGIFIKTKYWCCPHCGASLPWRTFAMPVHCMMCGKKLSDPPKDQPPLP